MWHLANPKVHFKMKFHGAGETAQQLGALAALSGRELESSSHIKTAPQGRIRLLYGHEHSSIHSCTHTKHTITGSTKVLLCISYTYVHSQLTIPAIKKPLKSEQACVLMFSFYTQHNRDSAEGSVG